MTILENTIHFPDSGIILFKTFSLILPLVDSSIVNEAIKTISSQFFYEKILSTQKRKSSQKQPSKQKKSKQKTTKVTIFCI